MNASTTTPLDTALAHIARGWAPVPVPYRAKGPTIKGWTDLRLTAETAPRYFNGEPQNVGVITGEASNGLVDVDLDCPEAIEVAPYFLPSKTAIFGRESKPNSHWIYVAPSDLRRLEFKDPEGGAMLVEARGTDHQTVFPGSTHPEGEVVSWESGCDGEPAAVDAGDLLRRVRRLAAAALIARCWRGEGYRHDDALVLGGFLNRAGLSEQQAKLFMEAVARAAGDPEVKDRVKAVEIRPGVRRAGFPKLREWLGEKRAKAAADWLGYREQARGLESAAGEDAEASDDFDTSHDSLANELGSRSWDRDAKHVAAWNRWLFWDGVRWLPDERLDHMTRSRQYLRVRAKDLVTWAERKAAEIEVTEGPVKADKLRGWAKTQSVILRNKMTVAAVESLARSNPASVAGTEDFNSDLLLLGTPGGTVDLRTGVLRQARREDKISKLTSVAPAPHGTPAPQWERFLGEIFNSDREIITFLQRAAGYALTGITTEHVLFFLHGTGRNGKSTFLDVLTWLWGDYARRAPAATFLNSTVERHPTDIAGLQGARLVVGSELPRGKTWNESVIKDLTGGDRMTARFMQQNFFDFTPCLKLMIAGNTQPSIRGVDEAMRARLVLVPFVTTIPPERRDKKLVEKLKAEGPAILRWALDGAIEWQLRGLDLPACISAASTEYLDDEDLIGQFIADEVVQDSLAFTTTTALHVRFQQWTMAQGVTAWTLRTFQKALKERGLVEARRDYGRGFIGVRLR